MSEAGSESGIEETSTNEGRVYSIDKCYIKDSDLCTLRKVIYHICLEDNEVPSLEKLYGVVKTLFGFCGSVHLLRKVIKYKMGYKFKICRNDAYVPFERRKLTFTRQNYLRDIISIRASEGDDMRIVYIDELDIYYHDLHKSVTASRSSIEKYWTMNAAKESGFIEGVNRIIKYTYAIEPDEDHLDRVKTGLFMTWLRDILPKLPPNSIVILDNADTHNTWTEYIPNSLSLRRELRKWLREKNISFDKSMSKKDLYSLVKKHKPANNFLVDNLIEKAGHKAMRLPNYCDVNPLERILTAVKDRVVENSKDVETDLTDIIADATKSISAEYWAEQFQYVKEIEVEYFEKEKLMENVGDSLDLCPKYPEDDRSSTTFDYYTDFSSDGDGGGGGESPYEGESLDSDMESSGESGVVAEEEEEAGEEEEEAGEEEDGEEEGRWMMIDDNDI